MLNYNINYIIELLEKNKCLKISKSFKSQILSFKRKLPFEVFNELFSKCKNENICCEYITNYKQYLYLYEEHQFEKRNNLK